MELKEQSILFFTRTMALGGTENVVLQLCEIFKPLVKRIVVCSCGGINVDKLNTLGIRHYEIKDIEKKDPITIINVVKNLKYILTNENITIIHTHHRMAAFYVKVLGLYKKYIFINTSHNSFFDKRLLTHYSYENCHLIACGEMVKRNLNEFYKLLNVTVIHNAVKPFDETIKVDKEIKSAKDKGKFLIGNIGRLSEQKGMKYFVKAIPLVLQIHPESEFFIIGTGDEEKMLKELAEDLPVHFMGFRNDIQNLIAQLDLIVLTSLWEGLPLIPIETFSVGKTIIATNIEGTTEIVSDKKNGLLIKTKNSEELAEKICWVIEHPQEISKMERNARDTYLNFFSYDIFSKSYIDYYRGIE